MHGFLLVVTDQPPIYFFFASRSLWLSKIIILFTSRANVVAGHDLHYCKRSLVLRSSSPSLLKPLAILAINHNNENGLKTLKIAFLGSPFEKKKRACCYVVMFHSSAPLFFSCAAYSVVVHFMNY